MSRDNDNVEDESVKAINVKFDSDKEVCPHCGSNERVWHDDEGNLRCECQWEEEWK